MKSGPPRSQYTFYRSYFDAIQRLPKKDQSAIILAVCAYALYETEPSGLSATASACFALIRPTLDAGRRKAESGRKGGKCQTSRKQTASEVEVKTEGEYEYECISSADDEEVIVEQIIALYHSLCPDLPHVKCSPLPPNAQYVSVGPSTPIWIFFATFSSQLSAVTF